MQLEEEIKCEQEVKKVELNMQLEEVELNMQLEEEIECEQEVKKVELNMQLEEVELNVQLEEEQQDKCSSVRVSYQIWRIKF